MFHFKLFLDCSGDQHDLQIKLFFKVVFLLEAFTWTTNMSLDCRTVCLRKGGGRQIYMA